MSRNVNMKIARKINGEIVVITLTPDEMLDTYMLFRHKTESVDEGYEAEFFERYGRKYEDAMESLDDLATLMRRNIEEYGMTWEYARGEALEQYPVN